MEISVPKSWVRYKPVLCNNCFSGCCTLAVPVTSEELFHMGFIKLDEVNGPLKRIAARLIKRGIIQSFNTRNNIFTLKRHANNDCIFLDENRRCTTYESRPSVCRVFPMNSVRPGYCPNQKIR